jgi:hypothetical protein
MTFQTRQTQNRVVEVYDFAGAINRSLDIMRSKTDYVSLRDFGGIPDGSFSALTGTDNTSAFLLAKATGKAILIDGIYRIASPSAMILSGSEKLIGQGDHTGLVVQSGSNESGILVASAARIENMRIHLFQNGAKPPNQGQLHSVIQIGSGYLDYLPTYDLPNVSGFFLSNLTLTRTNILGGGSAIYAMGNVSRGYIGDIRDTGSVSKHSALLIFHWGGRTVEPGGYGQEVLATWHPRQISIGPLDSRRSNVGLALSSTSDVVQDGPIYCDEVNRALHIMPGDEGASKAVAPVPSLVGKGINIKGPIIVTNPLTLEPSLNAALVDVFSVGASAWDIQGNLRKWITLESDVTIGDVYIYGNIPDKQAVNVFMYSGVLKMGKVAVFGTAGVRTINIEHVTHGSDVSVSESNLSGGTEQISIRRAKGVRIGGGKINAAATGSTQYALQVFGEVITRTVAADASAGATEIQVTAAITGANRAMKGSQISIGGVVHTRLSEAIPGAAVTGSPGVVIIPCEPLPASISAGQELTIDLRSRAEISSITTIGGGRGVEVVQSDVLMSGTRITNAHFTGLRVRIGSVVTLHGVGFENTGATNSGSSFDLQVQTGLSRVTMTGGYLGGGRMGQKVTHNLQFTDVEGTHRRFTGVGIQFLGAVTGPVTASSTNNYTLVGCVDAAGNLLSNP